ncbi:MAG TPA: sigma factor-like helix-turn-helix DNA-binding protein, partial [Thermomicrobiaceae bacterium]|nr:sigma factor-like helix-turn-helix DNA-binding protein [Thermomicrobiaceae bacterium]
LILRYSGVSYAEIAAAIGIKPTSVGTTLVRAERALRLAYREGATESASRHYDKTLDESIESRKSKESTDGR